MKVITADNTEYLEDAANVFSRTKNVVALTGAGISVESGIDDFRSPGGIWSVYPPEEYATLPVFKQNPEKSWDLFRALGRGLLDKKPNKAHEILSNFETSGKLKGIVTQNVDNLHQGAGSQTVIEIHGNHSQLQCLGCGDISAIDDTFLEEQDVPHCKLCDTPLKPNVVLFGEDVRSIDEINALLYRCDLLLVIGTSAQVHPAASLPEQVKYSGGQIFEFNIEETVLTKGEIGYNVASDYFFRGKASSMLQLLHERMLV